MLKNPKLYFIALCFLVIVTAGYLWHVEQRRTTYFPPEEPTIIFRNTGWQDQMVLQGENRIYRSSIPTETATIIERTGNSFTVKWDNWGTEIFVKQDDGTYLIQS